MKTFASEILIKRFEVHSEAYGPVETDLAA